MRGESVLTLPRWNTVQGLPLLLLTVEGRALADPATGRGLDEAVIEGLLGVMVRHCVGWGAAGTVINQMVPPSLYSPLKKQETGAFRYIPYATCNQRHAL